MSDHAELERARNGDSTAVADLYRAHAGAAVRYARGLCRNIHDAEDLVAETFAAVIAQMAKGKGPHTAFRAYLFTTMRHRLFAENRREVCTFDDAVLDVAVTDEPTVEDYGDLIRAFSALRPMDQEILLLLDVRGLRPGEVASLLHLQPSAVSMRAKRARRALANEYLNPAQPVAADPPSDSINTRAD